MSRAGRHPPPFASLALTCAVFGAAPAARADELLDSLLQPHFRWHAFSGLTHTTNATRSSDGPADTAATVGAGIDFAHRSRRLSVDLRGSAWYETWLEDTFAADTLASFAGNLRYEFLPERLSWYVEERYGQVARSTLAPATPGNRSNANFLATGPEFVWRLGPTSGLRFSGRYARSDFDDFTELDDRRTSGRVAWYRRLSGAATVSVNAAAENVEYAIDGVPGYDVRQAYARIESRRARYGFAIDGGIAELRQRDASERSPLLRASLWRRLGGTWNVNLQAGQDYRNSGDLFRDAIGDVRVVNDEIVYVPPGVDPGFVRTVLADVTLDNRPLRYRYARLALDASTARTEFGVDLGGARERYEFAGQNLDRNTWNAGVRATRRLRETVDATVRLGTYRREFRAQQASDTTRFADASLQWQLGRRLGASVAYRYEKRDSDFDAFDYADHVFFVGVRYAPPLPQRVAPAERDPRTVAPAAPVPPGTTPPGEAPPAQVVPTPVTPRSTAPASPPPTSGAPLPQAPETSPGPAGVAVPITVPPGGATPTPAPPPGATGSSGRPTVPGGAGESPPTAPPPAGGSA